MKDKLKNNILKLYPEYNNVYGPYIRADNRKVVILYDGNKRTARQYAKVKLEVKLNRRLKPGEEVDHIDNDFTDNRYSNLQVLSSTKNRIKEMRDRFGPEKFVNCLYCGKKTKRHKFCSNSCRSKYYGANQYGNKLEGYSNKIKVKKLDKKDINKIIKLRNSNPNIYTYRKLAYMYNVNLRRIQKVLNNVPMAE